MYLFHILNYFQLLSGASLMVWIGTKARRELLKAIAEADNASNVTKISYV